MRALAAASAPTDRLRESQIPEQRDRERDVTHVVVVVVTVAVAVGHASDFGDAAARAEEGKEAAEG